MEIIAKSKQFCKKAMINSRALKFMNKVTTGHVAILKYHSIKDEPRLYDDSIDPGIIISTADFKEHMEIVSKQFNPVTINDVVLYALGEKKVPKRAVAVTFDDGYADNFTIAAPILEHFGIRAAFYVTVDSIGATLPPWFIRVRHAIWASRKQEWVAPPNEQIFKLENRSTRIASLHHACKQCANLVGPQQEEAVKAIEDALGVEPFVPKEPFMMTWDKIRKLDERGHIIGSHTLTHPNLAHVGEKELHWELSESKRIIENELDAPVDHFSYPNPALTPHLTKQTIAAVRKASYKTAVISAPGGPVSAGRSPSLLNRISVPSERHEFLWTLEWTLLGRHM
jgi:peptidoglycan/xylan/chitin deacetylase (PgdA/CDA1 family)